MLAKCCCYEEQLDNANGFILTHKCYYTKLSALVSIPSSLVKLGLNLCLLITLNNDIFFIIYLKKRRLC